MKRLLMLVALLPALQASAAQYFDEAQVLAVLAPGVKLKLTELELTKAETKAIASASGEPVSENKLRIWSAPKGPVVFIDKVVGKHDYIDYAVALSLSGTVQGFEIMQYRETYGYQVRDASWRAQFHGKGKEAVLRVKKDIDGISGATLSCIHVTGGVRRIVKTYDIIKKRIP